MTAGGKDVGRWLNEESGRDRRQEEVEEEETEEEEELE